MSDLDFSAFDRNPQLETIPHCSACNGLMRPHVLWFDELYTSHADFQWFRVMEASASIGLVLAVGTSFSVGITDFVTKSRHSRAAFR